MKPSSESRLKFKVSAKRKVVAIAKLPFLRLIYLSIAINVVTILAILAFQSFIPPEVPLYYGLPEGESQIAERSELIIPSMAALLVILVNISLSTILQNEYLKRTLVIVSLVITLLSLITSLEIIFLVGSF